MSHVSDESRIARARAFRALRNLRIEAHAISDFDLRDALLIEIRRHYADLNKRQTVERYTELAVYAEAWCERVRLVRSSSIGITTDRAA